MFDDSEHIFNVDLEDFADRVLEASSRTPVLVDLWAEWCSPCLMIAPALTHLIDEHDGRLQLAKVEVDEGENMKLAGRYKVRGFPTVILFIDAEEAARFSGAKPLTFLREFVAPYID